MSWFLIEVPLRLGASRLLCHYILLTQCKKVTNCKQRTGILRWKNNFEHIYTTSTQKENDTFFCCINNWNYVFENSYSRTLQHDTVFNVRKLRYSHRVELSSVCSYKYREPRQMCESSPTSCIQNSIMWSMKISSSTLQLPLHAVLKIKTAGTVQ